MNKRDLTRLFKKCQIPKSKLLTKKVNFDKRKNLVCHEAVILSWNKFQQEKELFIEEAYKKYITAYKIQQWWLHITMSPYYAIGRKFIDRDGLAILNEYNEMKK